MVVAAQSDAAAAVIRAAVVAAGAEAAWEGDDLEVEGRTLAVGGQVVTLRTTAATYEGVFVPLLGEHQAHNALLALAATEALLGRGEALAGPLVEEGFAAATSPGRLETVRTSPLIIVDAAHNPHGAAALAEALEEAFALETIVGVVGVLEDKDPEGILAALEPVLARVIVTASRSPRSLQAEDLAVVARAVFGDDRVGVEPNLPTAIDRAVALSESGSERAGGVVVTGSIALVAEARILLGADRGRDAA